MNLFLAACGASGPLSLQVESPGLPGETRAFDLPFVLIGRDARCDLRLSHSEVSERHAYLQVVDGQVLCVDLGSRSGVCQDGKRRRLIQLERNQSIRVGPFRIRLLGGDGPSPARGGAEPAQTLVPLDLTHRSVRQSRADLQGGFALVGSGADCPIRLVDPSVSHYHCSLVNTTRGLWVVDLLGEGGVRVNGHDVSYARVDPGDSLQIGHSVIRPAVSASPVVLPRVVNGARPAEGPAPTTAVETRIPPRSEAVATTTPVHVDASRTEPAAPPASALVLPARDASAEPVSPAGGSDTLLPGEPSAEVFERLLAPMVGQMALMQQQILDEFQQARAMLLDTFASLHDEHSRFLNHELDQLRQLSQELHALRADLNQQTRQFAERNAAVAASSSEATNTGLVASMTGSPVKAAPPSVVSIPGGPASLHQAGPNAKISRDRFAPLNSLPPTHNGQDAPPRHDERIHVALCDRISQIKEEHESRWRKLAAFLPLKLQTKTML